MAKRRSIEQVVDSVRELGGDVKFSKGRIVTVDLFCSKASNKILALLAQERHVRSLLGSCAKLSDRSLRHLAMWKELRHLACGGTDVTGSGLKYLHRECNLVSLNISGSGGTQDRVLEHVWRHTRIANLCVSDTSVTDEQLTRLPELKRLSNIALSGTKITDRTATVLGQMRTLRHVTLLDTQVTDRGVLELARLDKLEVLKLAFCQRITDVSVDLLIGCPKLRVLSLGETGVSKKSLRRIGKKMHLF